MGLSFLFERPVAPRPAAAAISARCTFAAAYHLPHIYREQMEALAAGGVDLLAVETLMGIDEAAAALDAAAGLGLAVLCSFSVEAFPDIFRRCTAAAAYHAGAGAEQRAHMAGKIHRPHTVMGLSHFIHYRQPGVRLGDDRDGYLIVAGGAVRRGRLCRFFCP